MGLQEIFILLGMIRADFTAENTVRVKGFVETIGTSFTTDFPIQNSGDGITFEIRPPTMDFFKVPNVLSELKIWQHDTTIQFIHDAEPLVT